MKGEQSKEVTAETVSWRTLWVLEENLDLILRELMWGPGSWVGQGFISFTDDSSCCVENKL